MDEVDRGVYGQRRVFIIFNVRQEDRVAALHDRWKFECTRVWKCRCRVV